VTLVQVAADREEVATESPPHYLSVTVFRFWNTRRKPTYNTVGGSKGDSANDGNTNNGELDDRISQQRLSIRVIFVKRPLMVSERALST
jgi:hypothetical protein